MFWQLVKRFNMFEMEVEKKERKKERKKENLCYREKTIILIIKIYFKYYS